MATTSSISVMLPNKTIRTIYCHYDGYMSHNGRILLEHYQSQSAAEALVSLGSISSLRERLAPLDNEKHSFESPLTTVTIAYHRDRGEDLKIYHSNTLIDFKYTLMNINADYNYLFMNDTWNIVTKKDIQPLTQDNIF